MKLYLHSKPIFLGYLYQRFFSLIIIYICVSCLTGFGPNFVILSENSFTTSIYRLPSEAEIQDN